MFNWLLIASIVAVASSFNLMELPNEQNLPRVIASACEGGYLLSEACRNACALHTFCLNYNDFKHSRMFLDEFLPGCAGDCRPINQKETFDYLASRAMSALVQTDGTEKDAHIFYQSCVDQIEREIKKCDLEADPHRCWWEFYYDPVEDMHEHERVAKIRPNWRKSIRR